MLKDVHTWTTLLYLVLMLPLGIIYFTLAVTGVAIGLRLALAPLVVLGRHIGWLWGEDWVRDMIQVDGWTVASPHTLVGALFYMIVGVVIVTLVLHGARAIARGHARLAKALLVERDA